MSYDKLIANKPHTIVRNPDGRVRPFGISDAVAGRNTHAGIYVALRLLKGI